MLKRVVVLRTKLLPFSETFIKEQVLSYEKWSPILLGQFQIKGGLNLEPCNYITFEKKLNRFTTLKRNFCKFLNLSLRSDETILRQLSPDLIHVHFGVDAVINWPVLKKFDIPIVITLHGYDINIKKEWWHNGYEGIHLKKYPEKLLDIAKKSNVSFIAVSNAIKDQAIAFGIPNNKIHISYIGIDTSSFRKSLNPFNCRSQILFIGRLVEKKGCEILLNAFSKIKEQHPEVELKIIGTGPLEYQLKELANKLKIKAIFTGTCTKQEIISELSKSAVLCLPSIRARNGDAEGFGLVLLEAAACGVPTVTSAFGGAKEGIVDGITGFSFPERDSTKLAQKLHLLLSNPELMETMGNNGRMFVEENFSIEKCTRSLEDIYDQLIIKHNV
ncbi:Colanic acid biosynthesis glycosyl transferase WcaL [Enterobacteriaceae bacterium bta3-1]|nr:Colanic acid biosynthesis glycosyl transferase WcaL [Enterobacteriaceae bacterium bta3-1]